jgi:hypothetical protein
VGVRGDRATHRLDLHDSVGHVDDERHGLCGGGVDQDVTTRLDAAGVRGFVEECGRSRSIDVHA